MDSSTISFYFFLFMMLFFVVCFMNKKKFVHSLQAGANEFGNDVGGNEMPRSEEEVGVRFHKGDGTETEPEVSGGGGGG